MVDNSWVITMQPVEGSQESLLLTGLPCPYPVSVSNKPSSCSVVLRAPHSSATASSGQLGYHLLCEIRTRCDPDMGTKRSWEPRTQHRAWISGKAPDSTCPCFPSQPFGWGYASLCWSGLCLSLKGSHMEWLKIGAESLDLNSSTLPPAADDPSQWPHLLCFSFLICEVTVLMISDPSSCYECTRVNIARHAGISMCLWGWWWWWWWWWLCSLW